MLGRAVETFDLYLLSVLREIFQSKPEMLKSESPVSASVLLEIKKFEDIVAYIAERKLHELAFKPLSELRDYIESRTGIDLFPKKEIYERVVIASEIRNLIAHNNCMANEQFFRRTKGLSETVQFRANGKAMISDEWVRQTSYMLDGVVFDFDSAAVEKFFLPTVDSAVVFIEA